MVFLSTIMRILLQKTSPVSAANFFKANIGQRFVDECSPISTKVSSVPASVFQPRHLHLHPRVRCERLAVKLHSQVRNTFPPAVRAFGSDGNGEFAGGVSLVQGASRGIGLEFARQLLQKHPEGHVVATCRSPETAHELTSLVNESRGRLTTLQIDVTNEATISAAAKSIKDKFGRLDVMVNAAGILHLPTGLQPETSIAKITSEALMLTYQINAMGPILMIKHMAPLLKAGGGRGTGREAAVIANISARVGSIGDNSLGGWYSYRSSKTALNQLTKTASVELARKRDPIVSILLHPGTVDTELSKPFQRNVAEGKLFTKQYSVERMLSIVDRVKLSDNGKFFAWDGQEIIW